MYSINFTVSFLSLILDQNSHCDVNNLNVISTISGT